MYYPREAERDHLFTRATLAFFMILLSLVMVLLSKDGGIPYAAIKATPLETIGIVTKIEVDNKIYPRTVIYYSFKTNKSYQVNGEYLVNTRNDKSNYFEGQEIKIVYSDWLPRFHTIKSNLEFNSPDFYIFSVGMGIIFLCLIFIAWTVSRIMKHKEEDHYY